MTSDEDKRLAEAIKEKLESYSKQSSTSQAQSKTQELASLAMESLNALKDIDPVYKKDGQRTYVNINMLPWRLAEAVYLYLHTVEQEKTEYEMRTDVEKFRSIAREIKAFMKGLKAKDKKPSKPAETQNPSKDEADAKKMVDELAKVKFSKNVKSVQDAVLRIYEGQPLRNGVEEVHVISRDTSSITIAKNDRKIRLMFDVA